MSETLLEVLRKGVSEFEASLETSRQGRRDWPSARNMVGPSGSRVASPDGEAGPEGQGGIAPAA